LNGVGVSIYPNVIDGILTSVAKKFNAGARLRVNLNPSGERKLVLSGCPVKSGILILLCRVFIQ
jgi:hypothetical protein